MPTPIGHALAGMAIAGASGSAIRLKTTHIGVLVFCAAAADLDLLLRFVDGVNHHRGASHSLGAAVLVGVIGFLLKRLGADLPGAMSMSAAWASHVVLDYAGLDTSPPIGELALWPFSNGFFASPVSIFYDVSRSFSLAAIQHNAIAVAIEFAILGPVAWLCWSRSPRS